MGDITTVSFKDKPYLWNIKVNIQMSGQIKRLSSKTHSIDFELSQDKTQAMVTLKDTDQNKVPTQDFHLLIRDSEIN